MAGEKEWYFYCPRDRKYRNSARPNRVTGAGFWKATGTDRPIYAAADAPAACIGLKKSLVFYTGRAAKGVKTDWMMHEYRLPPSSPFKTSAREISPSDSWAICRIFKKTSSGSQRSFPLSWASLPPVESVEPPPFSFSSMEMEPLAFSSAGAELPPAAESPPRFSLDVAALLQWMQPQFADGPFPSPSPSPSSLVGLRHPPKEKKEGAVFEENGTLGAAVLPFAPPQSLL